MLKNTAKRKIKYLKKGHIPERLPVKNTEYGNCKTVTYEFRGNVQSDCRPGSSVPGDIVNYRNRKRNGKRRTIHKNKTPLKFQTPRILNFVSRYFFFPPFSNLSFYLFLCLSLARLCFNPGNRLTLIRLIHP